jgi:hypothetical protein
MNHIYLLSSTLSRLLLCTDFGMAAAAAAAVPIQAANEQSVVAAAVANMMHDVKDGHSMNSAAASAANKIVQSVPISQIPNVMKMMQNARKQVSKADNGSEEDDDDEQVGHVDSRKSRKLNDGNPKNMSRRDGLGLAHRMSRMQPKLKEQRDAFNMSRKQLLDFMTRNRLWSVIDEEDQKEYIRERVKPKPAPLKIQFVDQALKRLRINKETRQAVVDKIQSIREEEADTTKKYKLKSKALKRKRRDDSSDEDESDHDARLSAKPMDVDG